MTNEELIVRLARELYDLKIKLGDIYKISNLAFESSKKEDLDNKANCIRALRIALIDIMHEVGVGEVYE